MAAVNLPTRESQVFPINDSNGNHPGESIIFVNGIMNKLEGYTAPKNEQEVLFPNREGAKVSAEKVSSSIDFQRVVLFYNPTFCVSHRDITVGEDRIAPLYSLLGELITSEHQRCSENLSEGHVIRVLVIAHSHGALLTYKALEHVDSSVRQNVEVATFGGAKLIPPTLGRRVYNYIHANDIIPTLAQLGPEEGNFLRNFLVEKKKEFLDVESDENQSAAICSALKVHEKAKAGRDPSEAHMQVFFEDVFQAAFKIAGTIPSATSEQQLLEHVIEGAVKEGVKLGVQKSYHIEILNSPANTIAHEFNTYYLCKAIDVIQKRTRSI